MNLEWLADGRVKIDPPKKPKKLTGTRFATILGLNPWSTPFEIWCAVTRTYEKPFEDTIYTIAGKVIEPKQADYMKKSFFMRNLVTPTDIWGEDYFKRTYGDFYPEIPILGGMWDYKLLDKNGKDKTILEMKTSKRVEDWKDDVPEYYALQAALYAYLSGVNEVIMVASFLEASDYDHPEQFVPSIKNTITVPFKLSERYPDFEKRYVAPALAWWKKYVETGISPPYDEKKDAEILKALRTDHVDVSKSDTNDLITEAEALTAKIEAAKVAIAPDEKRLKAITDGFKKEAMAKFTPGTDHVDIQGHTRKWTLGTSERVDFDKEAMKADGVYEKYAKTKTVYTLRCSYI